LLGVPNYWALACTEQTGETAKERPLPTIFHIEPEIWSMEMKSKLLRTALFAALGVSVTAIAAEDMGRGMGMNMGKGMVMRGDAKIEKAAPQTKVRPHSHVEEKTGFPQKAPEAMAYKPNAATDKTKHFHPRDGK
jgi:hypothetical protein